MPRVIRNYEVRGSVLEEVHQNILAVIQEMSGEDVRESTTDNGGKKVSTTLPSIWGWGGMKLGALVSDQGGAVHLLLEGYIAQLATGPLKKAMDEFGEKLSVRLGEGKLVSAKELPSSEHKGEEAINVKGKDRKMVLFALLIALVPVISGVLFRTGIELFIVTVVLGLGYYFGKKLFYKNTEN